MDVSITCRCRGGGGEGAAGRAGQVTGVGCRRTDGTGRVFGPGDDLLSLEGAAGPTRPPETPRRGSEK